MAPSKFGDFLLRFFRSIYNLTRRSPRNVTNFMHRGSMPLSVTPLLALHRVQLYPLFALHRAAPFVFHSALLFHR